MASAAIDAAYVSASLEFPIASIVSLLDAPTHDLVQSLLVQIESKVREYDSLKAEKLRADIELENAVRNGQAQRSSLKGSLDNALKEVEELRRKLNDEENNRASVDSELIALKSSTTTSSAEVQTLQHRISTLETSNRETLALLESKSSAHDSLAEELAGQHQKIVALRREASELQEKLQSAENASLNTKFKEQELQQEVDLLKRNNEWHENELKARATEYSKFRKEKAARIAELQRQNEDFVQSIESSKRTETTLRNRVDEISERAEDALSKVQELQEAAHKAEESFRLELDSANRLSELQGQNADTTRRRLKDVQEQLDKIREQAHDEIGTLQAEVDTFSSEKEAAYRRIEELETQIETLQSDLAGHKAQEAPSSVPGTPRRGLNGIFGTLGRAASPGVFSPNRSGMKGNLSFTQLYSENEQLKGELGKERHEVAKLRKDLEDVYSALERNAPQLEEMQAEYANLQKDLHDMSTALDEARQSEQGAFKKARQFEGQVTGLHRQVQILQQQLRDLGAQVKILLIEVAHRDDPTTLTAADRALFEAAARGELDDTALEQGLSESDRFISKRLTIFRDVVEAQEQNARLRHMIRGLQEQLEGEEAQATREQQERDRHELETLRGNVQALQDQMTSQHILIESFKKERDTYKAMHLRRSQIGRASIGPSEFAHSFTGSEPPATPQIGGHGTGIEASPSHVESLSRLLKDVQTSFDQFREESNVSSTALKQQVDRLSKEKSELHSEVAKTSSQLSLQIDRYELLQSNVNMLKTENAELQKRSQILSETASKQELQISTAMEQFVDEKALNDSLRNDNSNLKAERELWRKVEVRLTEDNRSLLDERSRLSKMIMDLQTLQNEKELVESENRRRLTSRADALETEMTTLKRKLDEEIEENKKATLRREYDQEQSRTRMDDLLKNSGSIKEELIAAKTQRDQLQARVDEIKIELRAAEEKALALQPRPTPRPQPSQSGSSVPDINAIDREQELAVEVSDLKRDLELAKNELEGAKNSVEQYRAISQASEDELQSLNETHGQYQTEMDEIVSDKDKKIQDLEKRIEEISAELSTTNHELSELRTSHDESNSKINDQKTSFEAELARLNDEADRLNETVKLHQQDKQAQAEIAQKAQQSYEDELVKHADAARALQRVRGEFSDLRNEISTIRAQAETAKITLAQSEASWSESRDRYERELLELTTRREDLNAQNKLLHEQIERLSGQITSIRQSRDVPTRESLSVGSPAVLSDEDNMQEVVRFLRREKEIVDIQYEGSQREAKRLKQQLDHAQTMFEQTREKLNQERQNQAEKEQVAMSHSNLLQTINELNAFRESNATLRNETKHAQTLLADKIKEGEGLRSQIQPLQTRLNQAEAELENKQDELRLITEDRDHWQKRVNDIIQKYDRVDPAELEGLRQQIQLLTTERDHLLAENKALQERVDGFSAELKEAEELRDQVGEERLQKLREAVKKRSADINLKFKEKDSQVTSLTEERDRLSEELNTAKQALEAAKKARDETVLNVQSNNTVKDRAMSDSSEAGEVREQADGIASIAKDRAQLEARLTAALQEARAEGEKAARSQSHVIQLQTRVAELEAQVQTLQQQLVASTSALTSAESGVIPSATENTSTERLQQMEADLQSLRKENADLRAGGVNGQVGQVDESILTARVEEQLNIRRAELEAEYNIRTKAAEDQFQKRADNMKKQLSTKLTDTREKLRQENDQAIQKLQAEHSAELERLKNEFESEIAKLKATNPTTGQGTASSTATAPPEAAAASDPAGDVTAPEPAATAENQVPIKTEASKSLSEMDFSDQEIREFISKNPVAKSILIRNVQAKISKERDELTEKLKVEQSKLLEEKLEEARKKSDVTRENAVAMEGKRHSVKLNMTENRLRAATAKIDVVETAARDAPQRPVGEVWAIAKEAKPVTLQPAQIPATPSSTPLARPQPSQPAIQAGTFAQPAAAAAAAAQPVPPGSFAQPSGAGNSAPIQQFGQPSGTGFIPNTNIPNVRPGSFTQGQPNPFSGPSQVQPQAPAQQQQQQQPTAPQQLPQPQTASAQNRSATVPNAGTGPAALRNIIGTGGATGIPRGGGIPRPNTRAQGHAQTGIPQPGGQNIQIQGAGRAQQQSQQQQNHGQRNTGAARGGQGAGRGRGQAASGGPSSPSMNPAAKQFVPGGSGGAAGGNKRARDDEGEASAGRGAGGPGKRARGGQGGGNNQ